MSLLFYKTKTIHTEELEVRLLHLQLTLYVSDSILLRQIVSEIKRASERKEEREEKTSRKRREQREIERREKVN